jgi:hypothetical protein
LSKNQAKPLVPQGLSGYPVGTRSLHPPEPWLHRPKRLETEHFSQQNREMKGRFKCQRQRLHGCGHRTRRFVQFREIETTQTHWSKQNNEFTLGSARFGILITVKSLGVRLTHLITPHSMGLRWLHRRPDGKQREATQLSAVNKAVLTMGTGNPPVLDPLAGIPSHPYFNRQLRFTSACDSIGRIRLATITIQEA